MKVCQHTLEGGIAVATGNRIKDQLAAIMEVEPETQADEDLLAARWLWIYRGFDQRQYPWGCQDLRDALEEDRKADIRRRRQEMAADGSYPWPTDEAERRQKRAKGGAPNG